MDLSSYKVPNKIEEKVKSERAELIKNFLEKLNSERGSFKPLTARVVAVKLGHVKTGELYFFYKKCHEATNFSRCFWGCLKTK